MLSANSGISTHINQLIQSELADNFKFIHFSSGSEGKDENIFQKIYRFITSPFYLIYIIFKKKPVLIHFNFPLNLKAFCRESVYVMIAKMFRKKIIWQEHGGYLPQEICEKSCFLKMLFDLFLDFPDAIVTITEKTRDAYNNLTNKLDIKYIPNTIELNKYSGNYPKGIDTSSFNLIYIGRLHEEKGIVESLESICQLKDTPFYNKVSFYIAGTGPYEEDLKERTKLLCLADKVIFLGSVFGEEKYNLWRKAHIFLFPTYFKEGLPYVLLESLASGTPVITTNTAGISDVIVDKVHGIIVKKKDVKGTSDAIKTMLIDPQSYRSMSRNCLERSNEYDIRKSVKEFSELYDRIIIEK